MKKADYEIVAALVLDDRTPDTIKPIRRELIEVEHQAQKTGTAVSTYLKGALAALGGVAALGGLSRGVIALHSEIETAEAGLATLLSANLGVDAAAGLRLARDEVAKLRRDAATGSGELKHYLEGMQLILGPGLALGATTDELRELTRNALTAGEVLRGQEGLSLATFDVMQALSGQVGDRTTPIVMQALQAVGITDAEYRALRPEERIQALNRGFGAFAEGSKLMSQTWGSQMAAFQDGIREVARTATQPMFDAWVGKLRDANSWMQRNQDGLQEMADVWGARLLGVWEHLIRSASTYAAIIGAIAVMEGAPGAGARAQRGLGDLATAGGFVGPMGRRGLPMRDLFTKAGAGSVARGFWAGVRTALPKVLIGSGIGAVLAASIDGVIGAWREFPKAAGWLMEGVAGVTDAFTKLIDGLSSWSGDGSILNRFGAGLLYVAGAGLRVIDIVLRLGATLFRLGGWLLQMVGTVGDGLAPMLRGDFSLARHGGANYAATDAFVRDLRNIWRQEPIRSAGDEDGGVPTDEGGVRPPGETNVFVQEVRVATEVNADPARVYRAFEEVADKTRRYAIAARRNPAFG